MAAEAVCPSPRSSASVALCSKRFGYISTKTRLPQYLRIRASVSHSMDGHNKDTTGTDKLYKELGVFSLRKKIEDAVLRAELLAPTALEFEEAKQIEQEQMIRNYDLWDDPAKSNEMLSKLADSTKVVEALKDLRFKAEEAKLITQLVEVDDINCRLFKEAYNASFDVGKLLDQYELTKLLRGPYEKEGACLIIKAKSESICSETWAERLLSMYTKWAGKQGYSWRIVEKCPSKNGGITCATIEFETEYAYGYLLGERGLHCMISACIESSLSRTSLAAVDVIPLFLDTACDLQINDEELVISSSSTPGEKESQKHTVRIQHIPTGISIQSSGERNQFANKIKALNRLKAKLLVIAKEQGVDDMHSIMSDGIVDIWGEETRRYISYPNKVIQDVKTGMQLHDLNYVLDGNIDTLIGAHIHSRTIK